MLANAPENYTMTSAGLVPDVDSFDIETPEELKFQERLEEQDAIDDLVENLSHNTDFQKMINRYLWEGLIR